MFLGSGDDDHGSLIDMHEPVLCWESVVRSCCRVAAISCFNSSELFVLARASELAEFLRND